MSSEATQHEVLDALNKARECPTFYVPLLKERKQFFDNKGILHLPNQKPRVTQEGLPSFVVLF
jgi:hypothetical protein